MLLPPQLQSDLDDVTKTLKWHERLRVAFGIAPVAIPLFIIMLAIALGLSIADTIAYLCTSGKMPAAFQWLCLVV